jgi:outer membrane protein assembly factor BamA
VGGTLLDVVSPVERWQLPEPDAGLATFFFKRDYLDYFGRHGANLFATAFAGDYATFRLTYGNERWSTRRARDVVSLFRDSENWRINPAVDDGTMHLFEARFILDSRNAEVNPWAGWYLDFRYEHGNGSLVPAPRIFNGATTQTAAPAIAQDVSYGRGFLDVRKYNRISPKTQLNLRMVLGGWLHGDPLPLERRFSVGGVGTLPGFDFRRTGIGTDVGQCSSSETTIIPGRPAQCERVALGQVEYRDELHSDLVDMFNRNGIHVRGAVFTVRPSAVAFLDAGRGWLVGNNLGTLRYSSGSLPGFDTYRADAGIGLDLGIVGVYVAKALTAEEPANFFIRLHNRF